MSSIEIYMKIEDQWDVFMENHQRFNEKNRTACLTESKEL